MHVAPDVRIALAKTVRPLRVGLVAILRRFFGWARHAAAALARWLDDWGTLALVWTGGVVEATCRAAHV
eukprot:scaffold24529_cov140-Isochrysis_galbana.AAC.12